MKTTVLTKEELQKQAESLLHSILERDERNIHNLVREYFLDGEAGEDRFWIDYSFPADSRHWNTYGIVHGGIAATLLDDCIGVSGVIASGGSHVMTLNLSLEYVRAMAGERFRVHTEIAHAGGHLITGTGEIYDEKGRLCVTSMAGYTVRTEADGGAGKAGGREAVDGEAAGSAEEWDGNPGRTQ